MVVLLTIVTPEIVRPPAGAVTWTVVPVVVKPVPTRVTGVAVPRLLEFGVIEARVGVPGETTVNTTVLLTPVGVVRETFRAVSAAVAEIVNVAVTVSGEAGHPVPAVLPVMVAVTPPPPPPPPPKPLMAVEPAIPHPLKVTVSEVPRTPVFGAIEFRTPG